MFTLQISPGASSDIVELKKNSPNEAASIIAILQEIKGNQRLLDLLLVHELEEQLSSGLDFNVSHWWEQYRVGKDLWRIRIITDNRILSSHRIVYGYVRGQQEYVVLGVVHRSFNYDAQHPISKRILAEYSEYCE